MKNKKQKTKNKVTSDNYSEHAMSLRPPSDKNLQYAFKSFYAKLYECLGEVYGLEAKQIRDNLSEEKIAEKIREIKKEIGDASWQFIKNYTHEHNMLCHQNKFSFDKVIS